jgi:hypothetical protein
MLRSGREQPLLSLVAGLDSLAGSTNNVLRSVSIYGEVEMVSYRGRLRTVNLRLAFMANEVARVLGRPRPVSRADAQILKEAETFLSTAEKGGQRLVARDFHAAVANEFGAFQWTAQAFATVVGRDRANTSSEVRALVEKLRRTLTSYREGADVDVSQARQFFEILRDLVLARERRPPQAPRLIHARY